MVRIHKEGHKFLFVLFVIVFAVIPIEAAINIIDISFALMAIPTLISTVWLAPKVIFKAREYFSALEEST